MPKYRRDGYIDNLVRCNECGALTDDEKIHNAWHLKLSRR